jgi:hypothetical protein
MEARFSVDRVRWVFDDYVVFADDRQMAEEIHDRLRSHVGVRRLFGVVELPIGTGYWMKIVKRH